jgi:hypothetical protein
MESNLGASPSDPNDGVNKSYVDSFLGLRAAGAVVATSESTSSTSYVDLTTTTDTVTVIIGASGIAIVALSVNISSPSFNAYMSYALTGANAVIATDAKSIGYQNPSNTTWISNQGLVIVETGLTPGSTTFKAKYRSSSGSGSQSFSNRRIAVIPL